MIFRIKSGIRAVLKPILPLIRSIRSYPARRRVQMQAALLKKQSGLSICYLTAQFPNRPALRTEYANGGAVKLTFLAEHFPHSFPQASILYTVSSEKNVGADAIILYAKQNGIKIILNQNGVSYPAWNSGNWQEPNIRMKKNFDQADFIVYQSKFCRSGALKFLGENQCPSQIIYNPVDINLYQPVSKPVKNRGPVLLLGGNQYTRYRFETALEVLKCTLPLLPEASLIVTGKLWGDNQLVSMDIAKRLLKEKNLTERVTFSGAYTQNEAPGIFQRADILLHTQYNDASPSLVTEAMAAGLPAVYSASGGVPELIGLEAGIGIQVENSWEKISLPDPNLMAQAVIQVWESLPVFSEAARQRAVDQFSLEKFIKAHQELFDQVLG